MFITQTVDIPDSRQFSIEVPRDTPTGKANIIIFRIQEDVKAQQPPSFTIPLSSKGNFRLEGDFTEPLKERQLGCLKGQIWMSEDFDEPLEDFKDYM